MREKVSGDAVKLKRYVVAFGRAIAFDRFRRGRGTCRRTRSTGRFGSAFTTTGAGIQKLKCLQDHAEFAFFLAALLIVPGFVAKAAFNQNRAAFFQVLADGFGGFAESV